MKRRRKKYKLYSFLAFGIVAAGSTFFYVHFFYNQLSQEPIALRNEKWLYWCQSGPETKSQQCYYVNQEGFMVAEAPRLEGMLFPKLYDERKGEKRIEEGLLGFVRHFYDFGQFVVKNDETLEIGWPGAMHIKISLRDDQKKVAETLALILEKEIGDRRNEVDYIDLRFGNRVYYKFR